MPPFGPRFNTERSVSPRAGRYTCDSETVTLTVPKSVAATKVVSMTATFTWPGQSSSGCEGNSQVDSPCLDLFLIGPSGVIITSEFAKKSPATLTASFLAAGDYRI